MRRNSNLKIIGLVCLVLLVQCSRLKVQGIHSVSDGLSNGVCPVKYTSVFHGARVVRSSDLLLSLRQTKTIGERINMARRYRGLTQQDVRERLEVTRDYIARLEADYERPSPLFLSNLAQVLNINVWYLLQGLPKEEALIEENLISRIPLIELALWEEERLIGERIKLARLALGLKQQELAEKLGIHPNYINAWERGRRFIPLDKIEVLASALEIDSELLRRAEIPPNIQEKIEDIRPVSFMGERIRKRKEELKGKDPKWTREYIAGLLGIGVNTLWEWETGLIDIYPNHIPEIAEVLEMDVWKLLTGKQKKEALERKNLLSLIAPIEFEKWGEQRIIGERLKLARLTKGYTLLKLSRKIKEEEISINVSTLSRYERGIHPIPEEIIPILGQILELKPSQLQLQDVDY